MGLTIVGDGDGDGGDDGEGDLADVVDQVRACTLCADSLPRGPRPVLRATSTSRILIVGQAPGTRVHETGIPWNDPSGDRLRHWMQVDRETFYDDARIAIIPMGFCYPGTGTSGDLPPRPECSALWHPLLLRRLPELRLILVIGAYAQAFFLGDHREKSLTDTVRTLAERARASSNTDVDDELANTVALPHPSPRNQLWLKKNPWFDVEVLPRLRHLVRVALDVRPDVG